MRTRLGLRRVSTFDDVPGARTIAVDRSAFAARAGWPAIQSGPSTAVAPSPRQNAPRRVAVLERCRLATGGGVVVTSDGALVMESLWDEEHYEREFRRRRVRLRAPTAVPGEQASLVSLWSENYYHWLLDALPRYASLQAAGLDDVPLVVPQRLTRFQRESLSLLGIPTGRLTPFVNEHVSPATLIWAPAPAHVGFPSAFVVDWLRRSLGQGTPAGGRRLYISRSGSRYVVNEEQVVAMLRRHGFEVIQPERMALVDQICAFEAADAVVAPHGAGIANIVFAQQLALLELSPPAYHNRCFAELARATNHDYRCLEGEKVPSRRRPRERPYSVSVDRLEASVREMLAS